MEEFKSLILVFSPTGNTKRIATFIQEINNAEMIELIPEVPYTAEDLNYNSNCRANREQNDDTARP
jgi:flavodoxin